MEEKKSLLEGKADEIAKEENEPALESQALSDAEFIKSLKIGSIDDAGNVIANIFVRHDDYIIYEIKTNSIADSVRVYLVGEELVSKFNEVRMDFVRARGLLTKANDAENLKARIASVVAHALSSKGDGHASSVSEEHKKEFKKLVDKIKGDYIDQSNYKLIYLITIFSLTVIGIISSLCVYLGSFACLNSLIEYNPGLRTLIYIITAGGIGGFLSVSYRAKNVKFEFQKFEKIEKEDKADENDEAGEKNETDKKDKADEKNDKRQFIWLGIFFSGVERFFISILGAVIVYLVIKSGLVLGTILEGAKEPYSSYHIYIISVLAGFSETFVPNLLVKLEKKSAE